MIYKTYEEVPQASKPYASKLGEEWIVTSVAQLNKEMDSFIRSPEYKALKDK